MPAGQLILSYRGVQDDTLTKRKKSIFHGGYEKYSPFAKEIKVYEFNTVDWGTRSVCKIPKDLDMLSKLFLHIKVPSLNVPNNSINTNCVKLNELECFCDKCLKRSPNTFFSWVNSFCHVVVNEYTFNIGGNFRDTRLGEWLEIKSEFTQTSEKRFAYSELTAKRDPTAMKKNGIKTDLNLMLPLELFFDKTHSLAFPLCATDDDIQLEVKWANFDKCWFSNTEGSKPNKVKLEASVIAEGYILNKEDREMSENRDHSYLIELVQSSNNFFYPRGTKTPTLDLNFNLCVKELYWFLQRSDVLERSSPGDSDVTFGNDHFNYSCFKSREKNITIIDPIVSAKLLYSGSVNTDSLPAIFYRLADPLFKHTKVPNNYIYNYTWSASPESFNPMGTVNLSEIPNIRLSLEVAKEMYQNDYNVRAYALSYNILFIYNRKVTLGYSI